MKLLQINQVAVAQEFHISVTPLGNDEYLVRIERVAPGVPLAEEQVRWPVEDWLVQSRQLMNDPLLGLLQGSATFGEENFFLPQWDKQVKQSSLNLVALGQQLYNAVFQGSLRDSWMMAQAIAQNQRSVLRLRLGLKGTRLPRLPWEVLHAGDRPLATGTEVAFSRYQLSTRLMRPVQTIPAQPHQPLKILMVISGPSDQETLELAQEASQLQEELRSRSPHEPPAIQLTILEQPGREQLTQALEQGQYQVFHYAGHSDLGDSGGDVYLVSNKTGLTETLNGDDLAGLLVNNGVQLAVFNSCRGAYTAASDAPEEGSKERNLAEALVKRGIPSVLAMAERIPDEVALTLTRLLYRNLNQGYPIDLSLSRARQGLISAYGSNQLYWALPVLYLHPEFNGFLTNTDDATHHRDELFTLPDPPDLSLPTKEALFTAPGMLNSTSYLDGEDDLAASAMADWVEYEDEESNSFGDDLDVGDADADDPSTFIQGLLRQLDPDSMNTQPGESEAVNQELPAPPSNQHLSQESAATIPPVGMAQASATLVNSPQAVASGKPRALNSRWQKFRNLPRLWMLLGATGILAIAVLGFWFFQNRAPQFGAVPSVPSLPQSPGAEKANLSTTDTAKVTNIAIEQLSQGNIAAGQKAVEELLNRGALQPASAALAVIPNAQLDDPTASFLRGRLAWQSVQTGSDKYNLEDARRNWETALKAQPKSFTYLNALGFAYYAEGDFDRANQAWFDALYVMEEAQAAANQSGDTAKQEALTTYAGLALGLRQSAQRQPADKRASLLNESLKLRRKVMNDDPVNFQPEALSKNWLWSEKAIQEWRSLLAATQ